MPIDPILAGVLCLLSSAAVNGFAAFLVRRHGAETGTHVLRVALLAGGLMQILIAMAVWLPVENWLAPTWGLIATLLLAVVLPSGLAALGAFLQFHAWRLLQMAEFESATPREEGRSRIERTTAWLMRTAAAQLCLLAILSQFAVGVVLVVSGLILASEMLRVRRMNRQSALLWRLALAAAARQPLDRELEQAAETEFDRMSRRDCGRLAYLLGGGNSLSQALDLQPGLVPEWVRARIAVAERGGSLAEVLHDAARRVGEEHAKHGDADRISPAMSVRLVILAAACWSGVSYMALFVAPKMKMIFRDFGFDLPPTFEAVTTSEVHFGMLMAPAVVVLLWLAIHRHALSCGRASQDSVLLRALAAACAARKPWHALQGLAEQQSNPRLAHATGRILSAVAWNGSPWQELQAQRAVTPAQAALLSAAENAGNLPWALEHVAQQREHRRGQRAAGLFRVIEPLTVAAFGGIVLLLAAGYLLPVVKIISQLAEEITR